MSLWLWRRQLYAMRLVLRNAQRARRFFRAIEQSAGERVILHMRNHPRFSR